MSLRLCALLLTKIAIVVNFTHDCRGPSYMSSKESEDAIFLRQCTLLPTKFANVMNVTHESRGPSYLSTTESEDAMSL